MALNVKYLVDTNIWLELLLNQEKAGEVSIFLDRTPTEMMAISDFSLHSIGVILCRYSMFEVFKLFTKDLFITGSITQFVLNPSELIEIPETIINFKIDFDDAYQYLVSKYYNLQIVSFDSDFKRAGINCLLPSEISRT
jgi:predicted nucleic acid-binding protein